MKMRILPIACALLGIFIGGQTASAKGKVEVVFDHPEKFTDASDSLLTAPNANSASLLSLKAYLENRGEKRLPDGFTLYVSFTDIDLAGDFRPERNASASNTRVVSDLYPPRLDFSYKLTDAKGASVLEGKEQLRDMNFMSRMDPTKADAPLFFEKDMLDDWLRATVRKVKK